MLGVPIDESDELDENLPFLFLSLLEYMFFKAYCSRNSELLEFYMHSNECEPFRKLLDLFYENMVHKFTHLSPIYFAAESNSAYLIEELLSILLSHDAVDASAAIDGITPLHVASTKDFDENAKLILEKTDNVNARDEKSRTPLHFCTLSDIIKCAKLLLTHVPAADLNVVDADQCTPLHLAARVKKSKVLKMLIENGANTLARSHSGEILLHKATLNSELENVKAPIEANPETVNFNCDRHITPLTAAIITGLVNVVDYLLSVAVDMENFMALYERDPMTIHWRRERPLDIASKSGKLKNNEAYDRFCNAAVKPNAIYRKIKKRPVIDSMDREASINSAILCSRRQDVIEYLLSIGASSNVKNAERNTPLHLALLGHRLDCVFAILRRGNPDVYITNREEKMARDLDLAKSIDPSYLIVPALKGESVDWEDEKELKRTLEYLQLPNMINEISTLQKHITGSLFPNKHLACN
ncbi:hypothetical protein HK098_002975 [Nowakowskiella sp. JEL0407]|nr:hypothetical protein HK098_002975 [Nowakowskiella sp. JEL0407]